MTSTADTGPHRPITRNRRARFDYEILDTFEAGLVLLGPEVKSLRAGKANLQDAYAALRGGEIYLRNAHISPYFQAGRENPPPRRERKLLLHRREIERLRSQIAERGLTVIPLSLYFQRGLAKVELGVARGRRKGDKRDAIRRREEEREIRRSVRQSERR